MDELWNALDVFLYGKRDPGTAYMSSSMPMTDPYTHMPVQVATLTYGGKTYSVELKETYS